MRTVLKVAVVVSIGILGFGEKHKQTATRVQGLPATLPRAVVIRTPSPGGPGPAAPPVLDPGRSSGTVRVRVLGLPEEIPLIGIPVELIDHLDEKRTLVTDGEGCVVFSGICPQDAYLWTRPAGWDGSAADFNLQEKDADVTLRLMPSGRISGVVVDGRDGAPLPGVAVRLGGRVLGEDGEIRELPDTPSVETWTGPQGEFSFEDVPHSKACVTAEATGFVQAAREFELPNGRQERKGLLLRLLPARSVRGRVVDPEGSPVAGAAVRAVPVGSCDSTTASDCNEYFEPTGVRKVVADAKGRFEFVNLFADGGYDLIASADDWAESLPLDLRPGVAGDGGYALALRRLSRLTVTVRAPDGKPVLGAGVWLDSRSWRNKPMEPDGKGGYSRSIDVPGRHMVEVEPEGYPGRTLFIDMEPEQSQEAEVRLEQPHFIRGTLSDDAGAALKGLRISADRIGAMRREEWCYATGETDAEGRFALGPLWSGDYRVSMVMGGDPLLGGSSVPAPSEGVKVVHPRSSAVHLRLRFPSDDGGPDSYFAALHKEDSDGTTAWRDCGARAIDCEDGNGEIRFEGDPLSDRSLCIKCPGYLCVVVDFPREPGKTAERGEIRLVPGVPLIGRVVDDAGEPVAGAALDIDDDYARGLFWGMAETEADGTFNIQSLPEGEVVVHLKSVGHFAVDVPVKVVRGAAPVTLILPRGGLLRATVVSGDLPLVAGEKVRLSPIDSRSPEHRDWEAEYSVNHRGGVVVRLMKGTYRVEALDREGAVHQTAQAEIKDGEDCYVLLRLPGQ